MNVKFDDLVITKWGARFQGRNFLCAIGRGGIGKKTGEGDGITPAGCYDLSSVYSRPDRINFQSGGVPQTSIGLFDVWSDDPHDANYNHRANEFSYKYSHEKLRRPDGLYDAFGVITYNWPNAIAGKGSAIFLHVWRKPRHPTEGCVAFDRNDLIAIFQNWTDRSRVIIRG